MKAYRQSRDTAPFIIIFALDGGEASNLYPAYFTPGEEEEEEEEEKKKKSTLRLGGPQNQYGHF
jgi:hypothetical protein